MTSPWEIIESRALANAHNRLSFERQNQIVGDSPIENLLFSACRLEIELGDHEFSSMCLIPSIEHAFEPFENVEYGTPLVVVPQARIVDWPIDFLFIMKDFEADDHFLAVECDGHDFHEKTKDQARRDRSRDRTLQEKGITIFRFTGSEIWRDPCRCADQIISWADDRFYRED